MSAPLEENVLMDQTMDEFSFAPSHSSTHCCSTRTFEAAVVDGGVDVLANTENVVFNFVTQQEPKIGREFLKTNKEDKLCTDEAIVPTILDIHQIERLLDLESVLPPDLRGVESHSDVLSKDNACEHPFECQTCKQSFWRIRSLVMHEEAHHNGHQKSLPGDMELPQELKSADHLNIDRCPEIGQVAPGTQTELETKPEANLSGSSPMKIQAVSAKKPYKQKCSVKDCPSEVVNMSQHMEYCHSSHPEPLICTRQDCSKTFGNKVKLRSHMRSHKFKTCKICNVKTKNMSQHRTSKHSSGERKICKYCPKTFANKTLLNIHMKTHDSPKKCPKCPKHVRQLNIHMKNIHGTPKICELCQKSFETPYRLKQHMRVHDNSSSNAQVGVSQFDSQSVNNVNPNPTISSLEDGKRMNARALRVNRKVGG